MVGDVSGISQRGFRVVIRALSDGSAGVLLLELAGTQGMWYDKLALPMQTGVGAMLGLWTAFAVRDQVMRTLEGRWRRQSADLASAWARDMESADGLLALARVGHQKSIEEEFPQAGDISLALEWLLAYDPRLDSVENSSFLWRCACSNSRMLRRELVQALTDTVDNDNHEPYRLVLEYLVRSDDSPQVRRAALSQLARMGSNVVLGPVRSHRTWSTDHVRAVRPEAPSPKPLSPSNLIIESSSSSSLSAVCFLASLPLAIHLAYLSGLFVLPNAMTCAHHATEGFVLAVLGLIAYGNASDVAWNQLGLNSSR
uniref:HEAT repeat domain-containing protein n=1 Tax=Compsopogon caeruleus TaxID=31354 RepID=A0A7S1XHL7_9RHOD